MLKHFLMGLLGLIFSINSFGQTFCRCQPNQTCWPTSKDWAILQTKLTGHLVKPTLPLATCQKNASSQECATTLKNIHNPFFNEANPGATQSQGYLNAWNNHPSEYAVEAESVNDIVAAVNFARQHKLKLVIKGTGHDYLGRSNAANSLLIWTHNMRQRQFETSFVPAGCKNQKGIPALTLSAGTRWLEAYDEATTKHQHYVQGGGCTTVGAAGGFIQGGGFGSFSKKYGTGAAGVLQVEIVTAQGDRLIANQCQNQELFWAVRGGGGGTFGVVTKVTLKAHALPQHAGILEGTLSAKNDEAYKKLIHQFLIFFRQHLNNEHWGEQFSFNADNSIKLFLLFQGLKADQIEKTWRPMKEWINQYPELYFMKIKTISIPSRQMWDYHFWEKYHPDMVTFNPGPNGSKKEFWYTSNSSEVSRYWYTYQSQWLPLFLFEDNHVKQFTDVVFKASRLGYPITFHVNKGLAGASNDAINQSKKTATNPSVYNAAALVIVAAGDNQAYLGVKGKEPNANKAKEAIQKINQAMHFFARVAPHAGAYLNEADYFQKDWQNAFWGKHYPKLFAIKQKYDPQGLFYCHHCVGSELWTDDGMCPLLKTQSS